MAKIAIIQTGGKQYVVAENDIIEIERLEGAENAGDKITFDSVLLTDDGSAVSVGSPLVKGAKVTGELVTNKRGPKITIIRYKQKSRYFKKRGHRQDLAKVKITSL
ncbi:MAG: 50S ribosomal protein L21 [Candidatus Pacebacteria bacterium]|nr:50S ribosomal protein L21 [Candidatus Paceibacterota bacterium]